MVWWYMESRGKIGGKSIAVPSFAEDIAWLPCLRVINWQRIVKLQESFSGSFLARDLPMNLLWALGSSGQCK